eukprot:Gb_40106 [translate_table: standard]
MSNRPTSNRLKALVRPTSNKCPPTGSKIQHGLSIDGQVHTLQICHYNYNRKPSSHKKNLAKYRTRKEHKRDGAQMPPPSHLLCLNRRMCDPRPSWLLAFHFSLCLLGVPTPL